MKITISIPESDNVVSGVIFTQTDDVVIILNKKDENIKEDIINYITNLKFNN